MLVQVAAFSAVAFGVWALIRGQNPLEIFTSTIPTPKVDTSVPIVSRVMHAPDPTIRHRETIIGGDFANTGTKQETPRESTAAHPIVTEEQVN